MEQSYSTGLFRKGGNELLDEKKLKEAESRVKQYLKDGIIL